MNETSLINELFKELQLNCKRWFIAFMVMVVVEVFTIGIFIWYITLPIDEIAYYEQTATQEDIDDSEIHQTISK